MAAIKDTASVGAPFSNASEIKRFTYDFSKDAGATGALDIFTALDDLVITNWWMNVKVAPLSGGSATVQVGITGALSQFLGVTNGAKASLTLAKLVSADIVEGTPNVIPMPVKLAKGNKAVLTIATAALTAGVLEFVFEVSKF